MTKARMAAVLVVCAAVATTCAEQKPATPEPVAPLPVARGETAWRFPSATTVAPTSAAPSEPAPSLMSVPAATPGKIWCETQECDLVSEVCCVVHKADGKVGSCVPRGGPSSDPCCPSRGIFCGNEGLTVQRSCDEAADCPAEQRCCVLGEGEGDLASEWCTDRCWEEVCVSGSKCVNGNVCAGAAGQRVGRCPMQIRPPECGGATCKMGQTCCWSSKERRGRCADACSEDADHAFECTSPEQCFPFDCNSHPGVHKPRRYHCGGGGFTADVLCQSLKDCPKHSPSLGSGPGAPTAKRCARRPDLPRGVKACEYE